MKNPTRRTFLKTAALALSLPTIIPASALGKNGTVAPSNRIVLGAVGIGPRGRQVLGCFLQQPDVQFVAIADAQADRAEIVRRIAMKKFGYDDCYKTSEMREIFERKDIDTVLTATGDHWHALVSILAAKAGSDVPGALFFTRAHQFTSISVQRGDDKMEFSVKRCRAQQLDR